MPTLLIPNFTFEDCLSGRLRNNGREHPAQQDLSALLGWLANPNDVVLQSDGQCPSDLPDALKSVQYQTDVRDTEFDRILPWGWDDGARKLAERLPGCLQKIPSADSVRCVNGRAFSHQYDTVLFQEKPLTAFGDRFSCYCRSESEWVDAINRLQKCGHEKWVTKAELSHAGRNRLLGGGTDLNQQQSGWLRRQLAANGVAVEPWVERMSEFSLQFDILSDGQIRLVGQTGLLNDPMGRYQGTVVSSAPFDVPGQWVEQASGICKAIFQQGYFGPVGLDGFQFRHDQKIGFRICNDVNARLTMGRLALEVAAKLGHSAGFWRQITPTNSGTANFRDELAIVKSALSTGRWKNVHCERTSAFQVGRRSVRLGTAFFSGVDFQREGVSSASEFDKFLRFVR